MFNFTLHLNTRDKFDNPELYLAYTGSSIEAGDESLVAAGTAWAGSSRAIATTEGISGENPVCHTGKMYWWLLPRLPAALAEESGVGAEMIMIGQSGQRLSEPWQVLIDFDAEAVPDDADQIINDLLNGKLNSFQEFAGNSFGRVVLSWSERGRVLPPTDEGG